MASSYRSWRLLRAPTQHQIFALGFELARLQRALISSLSIFYLLITEAGRSPKASVGAKAASEARTEKGVGVGVRGHPWIWIIFGTKML